MCGSFKFTTQMTVISNSVFAQRLSTYMTRSSRFKVFSIIRIKYHLLREFKLIIYLLYSLFKTIYKYPSHIVVFAICSIRYGILLVQTIIEAFYVITKRARSMFLVCIIIRHTRVWLASVYRFDKCFEICINNKWNSHGSIIVFKT